MYSPLRGMTVGWNHSKQGKSSCIWEPAKEDNAGQNFRYQTLSFWHFAAEQMLWNQTRQENVSVPPSLLHSTWMSSSLLSNSDTKTFFPSASLVRETQSFPEARRWASAGSFSCRMSRTVRSRLKVGWKTPRVCFLASLAMFKTSTQKCSEEENVAKSVCGDTDAFIMQ